MTPVALKDHCNNPISCEARTLSLPLTVRFSTEQTTDEGTDPPALFELAGLHMEEFAGDVPVSNNLLR
jgi:hypothetical protein